MEYNEQALAVVQRTGLLPVCESAALSAIAAEIQDTWQKRQIWRTETEARWCVLNDVRHPTRGSKYWQAVREQAVFIDQLVHLSYDYEVKRAERDVLLAEAEELEQEADGTENAATQRRLIAQARIKTVEAERAEYVMKDMRLAAHDRQREILMWSKLKAELDDGTFDTADPNTHQPDSYREQFRREAMIAQQAGNASPSELRNIIGKHLTAEASATCGTLPGESGG